MSEAWRLVATVYAERAFDGERCRYGNRWNHPSLRVVYLAASTSLAALEILVHAGNYSELPEYQAFRVRFPDVLIAELEAPLPADWQKSPAPAGTKDLGTQWVQSSSNLILRVPSVVVPWEHN